MPASPKPVPARAMGAERSIVLTPRGQAVVAIIRLERRLPELPGTDRQAAIAVLAERLDTLGAEDRAYVAPLLADLTAAIR